MYEINETHDPSLKSWVESANDPATDFPIQNLPFCQFERNGGGDDYLGIAIGDQIFSIRRALTSGLLGPQDGTELNPFWMGYVDAVMSLRAGNIFRQKISEILSDSASSEIRDIAGKCLIPCHEVKIKIPVDEIHDYTDFYCSIYHATNVGSMFRPDNPLMPNYKYVPIGYHGRASSIVVSGTPLWKT